MTAYVTPPRWEHGDRPVAVDMNKYSTALTAIYEMGDGVYRRPLSPYNPNDRDDTPEGLYNFTLTHRLRYLHFCGNDDGQIILADTSRKSASTIDSEVWRGENALTSLTGEMAHSRLDGDLTTPIPLKFTVMDLDTVSVLSHGAMYLVRDVWTCFESDSPD